MQISTQIAKLFRDVHFGGNWTAVNLKDQIQDIEWKQAIERTGNANSIASLVFHMNYYVTAIMKVLEGGPLDAHDKYSFDMPPVNSAEDWQQLQDKSFFDATRFASLVEQVSDEQLWEDFSDPKYGNYYRNLHGVIEHCHYHLGQIAILKKRLLKVSGS